MSDSYFSQYKLKQEQYDRVVNTDMALIVGWLEDTLEPSVNILQLKVAIDGLIDKLNAKELTREILSIELPKMLALAIKLEKIAVQNNTFQLVARHSQTALANAGMKIKALEDELLASRKGWEDLPG